MKNFSEIEQYAIEREEKKILSVACPYDINILTALSEATLNGIIKVIIFGDKSKINKLLTDNKIDLRDSEIIHIESNNEALQKSLDAILENKADIIMKGIVDTKLFMSTLLSAKSLIKADLLTHVAVYELRNQKKLLFVSDPSIMIEPTIENKKTVIENAYELMVSMGIYNPKIAIVSSTEKPNPKIKSSVDAFELANFYENDERFSILGPIGIDIAVNDNAASIKNIHNPVAGKADLLIMPNLDSGNIFCKGLTYLGNFESAGIVKGAKYPIILTSRSASVNEKYNSILIASTI